MRAHPLYRRRIWHSTLHICRVQETTITLHIPGLTDSNHNVIRIAKAEMWLLVQKPLWFSSGFFYYIVPLPACHSYSNIKVQYSGKHRENFT